MVRERDGGEGGQVGSGRKLVLSSRTEGQREKKKGRKGDRGTDQHRQGEGAGQGGRETEKAPGERSDRARGQGAGQREERGKGEREKGGERGRERQGQRVGEQEDGKQCR